VHQAELNPGSPDRVGSTEEEIVIIANTKSFAFVRC